MTETFCKNSKNLASKTLTGKQV